MPQLATLRKAPTVASRSPNGGLLLHCAKQTQACIRAVYTGSAFESQWADATCTFSGKLLAPKRRGPKNKSGRGPPTSPTLRPRVLTPRDHFAHRGGGRGMIIHKSPSRFNHNLSFFVCFLRPKIDAFMVGQLSLVSCLCLQDQQRPR